jgi:hypothetical protein
VPCGPVLHDGLNREPGAPTAPDSSPVTRSYLGVTRAKLFRQISGDPSRRFTGRRDELEVQDLARASERCSTSRSRGSDRLRGSLHIAGFRVVCLSRRLPPCRLVRERGDVERRAPRARSVDRSPHHPPRAGIFRCRRRLSQPPGSTRAERLPQGFSKTAPPSESSAGVHSRELAPASACTLPASTLVPPAPFLPASTVSSTNRLAGLLHPASDHGVHRVSAPRRRMPASSSALSHRCLPSRAFPFREAVPTSP